MRFLIRLIVILVAAVAIAIVGLLMLPGDKIASIAADQLSKQTGRKVSISSDTSISLYPILGVTTGPASIGTAQWAKNGPLLQTESLAIGVDVMALIGGTIRITKLEAKSPAIVLERAADGRANWELLPSSPTESQPEAPASTTRSDTESGQSFDLSLEQALITNASLRYIDHNTGTDQRFDSVDLELRWPDSGGAADIILAAAPFTERLELAATVGNVLGLIGGAETPLSGTLTGAGANMTFEGIASITPVAAMQITAKIANAGDLLRALGQDPAGMGLPASFAPNIDVSTQLSFDGTRLALRKTNASIDGSSFSGDTDVVLGDTLQITALQNVKVVSAGKLMRTFGQAPESFGLSPEFNPSATASVKARINGSALSATLSAIDASLEDTKITGNADIALSGGTPSIKANLALNAPNLARTAQLLGQPLSNFGLASSAAPALRTNVVASMSGSNITADLSDLSATLAGANASGTVKIALASGTPSVSGTISANVPNTAGLMSALGQTAPDIPKGFGRAISAKTTLNFANNALTLSGLNAKLDQNNLSGNVSIGLGQSVPNIKASLQGGDLDFSSLAPADDTSSSSAPGQGWPKDRIDASALGLINGNISLKARSINLGKFQLGGTDIGVTIDRSRAVVSINDLRAYQGSFAGQFVANNRNGLSVGGDLRANSIALKPLLTALADVNKITGSGSVAVKFLGVGNSVDAIMKSLSGSLSMSVPQGTVAGIDLEGLIRQGNANASLTPFSNLAASGTIAGGVVQNSDLTASAGKVNAKGEGQINLGAQTINYLFTPSTTEGASIGRLAVPVRIKGPWSSPSIRPDLEAALNLEAERKRLEEEARQAVEREKEILRQRAKEEEDRIRAQVEAEKKKLEDKARQAAEDAARRAADNVAKQLQLDEANRKRLEDAAKNALEKEVGQGLRNLLGGN